MSEINTTKINSAVGNAVDWLFNRARVTDNEHPCCGGLVNDYDMATGQWNIYESFWHTAQAVRALIALDKTSLPETAGMMAYLAKRIIDAPDDPAISGAICRVEGRRKGELATTTLTDGLPGVVDAYLTTGAPELRAALARSGNWLETCALDKATGFCYSFMDGKSGITTAVIIRNSPINALKQRGHLFCFSGGCWSVRFWKRLSKIFWTISLLTSILTVSGGIGAATAAIPTLPMPATICGMPMRCWTASLHSAMKNICLPPGKLPAFIRMPSSWTESYLMPLLPMAKVLRNRSAVRRSLCRLCSGSGC